MVDITSRIRRVVQQRIEEEKRKVNRDVYFRSGLQVATEDIVNGMFTDARVARATEVFESLPDLPTDERLQHAMVAALGYRLMGNPRKPTGVAPLDELAAAAD